MAFIKASTSRLNKKVGFTLSEVLLVLSVIGVVAALTIPTLVQKVGSDQNVVRLKKTYSVLSQAFNLMIADDAGNPSSNATLWGPSATDSKLMNVFAGKMNFLKTCTGSGGGCWYTTSMNNLNPALGTWTSSADAHGSPKAVMADGTLLMFAAYTASCTTDVSTLNDGNPLDGKICGYIRADVNGSAGPNIWGRDIYGFWLTQSGVYPWGSSYDTSAQFRATDCNPADATNGQGFGCAGKVITEGAIRY